MGWIMNIYIVNPGDTVSSIAEVTGAAEEELVYINQIAYPYLLAPGQALLLPPLEGGCADADGRAAVMAGYAYPFIDEATLAETLNYLTSIYVFSYGFRADGTLAGSADR